MKTIALTTLLSLLLSAYQVAAQNGISVPEMTNCDNLVNTFLSTYGIPGASFAMTKDGKLVYMRSFGNANLAQNEPTRPYHLFRIASLSKPITAIAIMKLMQDGMLTMDDKVFGTSGILESHPILSMANITDNRIYDITVRHLLEHSAGWNRNLNCFPNPTTPYPWFFSGCDPIVAPLHVTQQLGATNPASEENLITFLLEKTLDFTPNTGYSYSNIGYLMLGEIIETLTGMPYEDYVKNEILTPLKAYDMYIGKNLQSDKREREAEYHGNGYTTLSCYGTGLYVPWEYGGFNLEAMDAHGGWIASARDLLRLIVAVDGFPSKPDILTAATLDTMTAPSLNNAFYAKGWSVNSANNWWHTGSLDGTATILARTFHGYTWVILLNKRVIGTQSNNFWSALDNLPWNCISQTSTWPTHDLFNFPCINTNNACITYLGNTSAQFNWNNGDGQFRVLIGKEMNVTDRFPLDGVDYTSNASFGAGSDLGNGNYVLYNGTGNSVVVSDLNPNSTYYFRLFEYNKNTTTGNHSLYLLANSPQIKLVTGCPNQLHIAEVFQNINKAAQDLTSNAILDKPFDIIFKAGQTVELQPGFQVAQGQVFDITIETCQ